jgi:anthranilate synthase component II
MLLIIDNYDSFTYNLVHYCAELGAQVEVYRNDAITLDEIEQKKPSHILISPGPCTPNEAGISVDVVKYFGKNIPILGVCLGHQAIGAAFGVPIIRAKSVMHGKLSNIYHNNTGVFAGIKNEFTATRYHSLVLDSQHIPAQLKINAWTQTADGKIDEIMGIEHVDWPIYGVQFHPESILSEFGHDLLNNFLKNVKKRSATV